MKGKGRNEKAGRNGIMWTDLCGDRFWGGRRTLRGWKWWWRKGMMTMRVRVMVMVCNGRVCGGWVRAWERGRRGEGRTASWELIREKCGIIDVDAEPSSLPVISTETMRKKDQPRLELTAGYFRGRRKCIAASVGGERDRLVHLNRFSTLHTWLQNRENPPWRSKNKGTIRIRSRSWYITTDR